jgi:hypothetical protein
MVTLPYAARMNVYLLYQVVVFALRSSGRPELPRVCYGKDWIEMDWLGIGLDKKTGVFGV